MNMRKHTIIMCVCVSRTMENVETWMIWGVQSSVAVQLLCRNNISFLLLALYNPTFRWHQRAATLMVSRILVIYMGDHPTNRESLVTLVSPRFVGCPISTWFIFNYAYEEVTKLDEPQSMSIIYIIFSMISSSYHPAVKHRSGQSQFIDDFQGNSTHRPRMLPRHNMGTICSMASLRQRSKSATPSEQYAKVGY